MKIWDEPNFITHASVPHMKENYITDQLSNAKEDYLD